MFDKGFDLINTKNTTANLPLKKNLHLSELQDLPTNIRSVNTKSG